MEANHWLYYERMHTCGHTYETHIHSKKRYAQTHHNGKLLLTNTQKYVKAKRANEQTKKIMPAEYVNGN